MKSGFIFALFCLLPTLASADIYKNVGADGHVTYSSAPLKGGKRIIETPAAAVSQPARSRSTTTPADFPKVNQDTQNSRDETRRKILEDELKIEQGLLNEAQHDLKAAEANPKTAKNSDLFKGLVGQVELHSRNVDALNLEISKIK